MVLVVESDADDLGREDRDQDPVRRRVDVEPGTPVAEQLPVEQPPFAVALDDMAGRPFVVDPVEAFHARQRAVSSTRVDCGLMFGGVARSTATIA